jgi:hypothetical protein
VSTARVTTVKRAHTRDTTVGNEVAASMGVGHLPSHFRTTAPDGTGFWPHLGRVRFLTPSLQPICPATVGAILRLHLPLGTGSYFYIIFRFGDAKFWHGATNFKAPIPLG